MGTSFAAPVVAGVAALVISANPSLTSDQIQAVLKQSTDDLGEAGWDASFGSGRVNAANAVSLATNPPPPPASGPTVSITSPSAGSTVSGNVSVTVRVTPSDNIAKVELYVDGDLKSSSKRAPYTNSWNSRRSAGPHTLLVKAYDRAGRVGSSSSVPVVVQ